ncbi:MAG: 1-acyl-sn-glycerol-3-phosphate acyltransferase [Verrucomicrobiae bacterium]|nr:1-acyl-sn-glycerol-3-phosphate acyltransferase [Verrucomicrobiae bacterium]MCX7722352.1 1-acyl-sn-glycerol-3-phosphate acyltransferase [Verrucomicrobiae bacterium]
MRFGYRVAWHLLRCLFRIVFRWRVFGAEHVPARGPFILAANHASYLDPPVLGAACPRELCYLARKSLFRFKPFAALIRWCNAVPVERDGAGAEGLKTVLDKLGAGWGVLMFPEGTRSPDGRLQPGRLGIGLLVVKSRAPVVPVRVFGTDRALGRGAAVPRPCRITVVFGAPLDFTKRSAEARNCSKAELRRCYQQIADEVMSAIAKLGPPRQ